jgi:hypothetical protein
MKIKTLLIGLLSGFAIATATVLPSLAQSYDPFPQSEDCPVVIDRICHGRMPNGSPILFAIPAGYNGKFVLTATRVEQGYLIFMHDAIEDQVAAYMYLDQNAILMSSLNGRPAYGGDINMLDDVSEEIVDIFMELKAYYQ